MATLRALECLVAVADSGSITEAARLIHSSQPAVSQQIAALERETRTPLLRREPRGVSLTPAGRAAVADARRAIDAAAAAVRSARAAGEAKGGTLRLVCAQSLTVPLLAPVIRAWHRHLPHVAISVREAVTPVGLFDSVDGEKADLWVLSGPVDGGLTASVIAEEEIVLTAPRDHRLAAHRSVELPQLDGEDLVHFAPDNGLSNWLDWSLSAAGLRLKPVLRTSVTAAAPQLAAAGLGIAITPVSAVSAGFPGLVRSFSPRWARQLVAVTPGEPDPLVARFIADLRTRGVRVPRDVRNQLEARDSA
ncbi:LysR family transcriptional regulator [Paractinoplanes abujensis]|uniref:DNA-binding transcriptional LysR family regulator n=1 Tax=Paractinoplanes abujensis TaxID=882441 RepID=A0A7W7CRF8_9ACTN|nr:LysR family transcriptional regulator [Actinoplanes abujensis]MBB4693298.1 DNA-binding transcriptional LysR family regulator [Actinoplanes abujensis]GID24498.1 LysR family transcriptional regulator [Actinoplanes abujensis]